MAEPPERFRDNNGAPTFAPCVVLFLDLLGTAGERNPSRILDRLQRTKRAVDEARRLSPNDASDSGLWRMSWFSDNLGLHYAISKPLAASQAVGFVITDVGWLQLAFLQEGLIARGAVAVGDFYADAEFIHGPALEHAVALEKTNAKSPRVILDDRAVAIAHDSLTREFGGSLIAPWREQLLINGDDTVFVDYLSTLTDYETQDPEDWRADLERHRDLISGSLHEFRRDEGVRSKYIWLAAYHNDFLQRYSGFLGRLVDELTVSCDEATAAFVPFGHDVDELPEESIGS